MYRMIIFVYLKLAPRIRGKIRIDSCKNRYYTYNTQGSHSFTKQSNKVCMDNGKKIPYVTKCLHLGNSISTTGTQRSLINNAIADLY